MFSVKDDQEWRIFEKNSLINSDSIAPLTESIEIDSLACGDKGEIKVGLSGTFRVSNL